MTGFSSQDQLILYREAFSIYGALNIPPCCLKLRRSQTTKSLDVFDSFRRRWVALTPEEWVRQHFTSFMIGTLGFSPFRIANEVALKFNGMNRRADTVVYDDKLRPLVIVEYKAPNIELNNTVLQQALLYNLVFEAPALMITNGKDTFSVVGDKIRKGFIDGRAPQEDE